MADAVAARLRHHGLVGRTITLKVRFHDFRTITRSVTVADRGRLGDGHRAGRQDRCWTAIDPTTGRPAARRQREQSARPRPAAAQPRRGRRRRLGRGRRGGRRHPSPLRRRGRRAGHPGRSGRHPGQATGRPAVGTICGRTRTIRRRDHGRIADVGAGSLPHGRKPRPADVVVSWVVCETHPDTGCLKG